MGKTVEVLAVNLSTCHHIAIGSSWHHSAVIAAVIPADAVVRDSRVPRAVAGEAEDTARCDGGFEWDLDGLNGVFAY